MDDADSKLTEMVKAAADPMRVMRRVVDEALALIPGAEGAVVELAGGQHLTYVCAAGTLQDSIGTRVPNHGSLSGLAMLTGETLRCDDAAADDRVDKDACLRVGVVSMICVPLRRGAEAVGALKLSSARTHAFNHADVQLLSSMATFISQAIVGWADMGRSVAQLLESTYHPAQDRLPGNQRAVPPHERDRAASFVANLLQPGVVAEHDVRARVEAMLRSPAINIQLQPVIDLKTSRVAGCEALARFTTTPPHAPDKWFAEAQLVGLGAELQLLAVDRALALLDDVPNGLYMAINVGHDVACLPELTQRLAAIDAQRIVVELTEHLQVQDYDTLTRAVSRIRDCGARVAIDDTGAGFAGFSHILKLAPDLIKLDRILTTGIDTDPARQALASALVNFASATRAQVIAEGIETSAELETVRSLGIAYGQGYLLGRPGSVADLAAGVRAKVPTAPTAMNRRAEIPDASQ